MNMALQRIKQIIKKHKAIYGYARSVKENINKYSYGLQMLYLLIIGYVPSHSVRNYLYQNLGLKLGKGSSIYGGAEIRSPKKISIGCNSIIGNRAILDGRGCLEIGNNVNMSTGVWIWTMQHDKDDPCFGVVDGKVIIEDYVWLSCRVTILPNTRIGRGAVICAGAVVTDDIEPYSVVAGVPAKKIGERNQDMQYKLCVSVPFI